MTKRVETTLRYAHISVELRISEGTSYWNDPSVTTQFQIELPVELIDPKQLASMIKLHTDALSTEFEAEKMRFEAERLAKEEAERVQAEIEA